MIEKRARFLVAAWILCVGLLSAGPALAGKINPQYSLGDVVNTWQPPDPGPRPPLVSVEYDRYRVTGSGGPPMKEIRQQVSVEQDLVSSLGNQKRMEGVIKIFGIHATAHHDDAR